MRPTKLLTISAIAGLSLISYGISAQAAPVSVSLSGSITPACTLTTTNGGFAENTTDPGVIPSTQLSANGINGRGSVSVTCNGATSLDLDIGSTSKYYNGDPAIRFVGAANSIFPVVPNNGNSFKPLGTPISVSLASPTKSGGDTGYIEARIVAPANRLLKAAEDYNLVVNVKITP